MFFFQTWENDGGSNGSDLVGFVDFI